MPTERDTDPTPNLGLSERGIGLYALFAGAALTYLGYISPISSALSGAPSVSTSMTCAGIVPLIWMIGIAYTALGDRTKVVLGYRNQPTIAGWCFYAIGFVAGGLGYWMLLVFLRSHGYDV
ncbi:hypothetical protein Poly51_48610 [Rubripirellula tenax]|uniref:Uncharacterized protein n=1 Tax=Rubripirellula tenax TaxID=2528015 RepID=A0A5C6ELH0_9BACT|nr:hypothetical protein [Rubripirellula tenax]TWU48957.1 hypothetical protein Poly51_48610 [Rubripirellula tenax]